MILHIKNMVCNRCITAVEGVIKNAGFHPERVSLGEVVIPDEDLSEEALSRIDDQLRQFGFERISDRKAQLIEAMKSKIIQLIHHNDQMNLRTNWSEILSEALHYDYNYLSSLFSAVEGITVEHYIIQQRIEKAKELLLYDELTLSQIANQLGYSSVAHLSAQFKKVTGLTPTALKKSRVQGVRKPIDKLF